MKLSEIIIKYRKEHGLSQRQLSSQCDLSTGYISLIEREVNPQTGKVMVPSLPVLNKLAKGMGMMIDDLLSMCDVYSYRGGNMDSYEMIKKLRIENNMSQEELAHKAGYTDRSSIAKIESGKVDLTETKIIVFAKIFGISPAELMGLAPLSEKQKEHSDLTPEEVTMINAYRKAPEPIRSAVDGLLFPYTAKNDTSANAVG